MVKKSIGSPRKGMNRDTHPGELGAGEYCFALNANIHDEHGTGRVLLQNESSNIKCTGFREGYKVIGHKYDVVEDQTYFFLTNPITGLSEIGSIGSFFIDEGLTPVEQIVDGQITVVLETPLEDTTQVATCNYIQLITDECDIDGETAGCLNFSVDSPIHESNIHIKHTKLGPVMFFIDDRNPDRYVKLYDIGAYYQDKDDCTDVVIPTCLQCNKMRVFPLHNKPCISASTIQNGGNTRAGMYEVLISGCDSQGNEITDYYSKTHIIPIFDRNNIVLDQTTLDYRTNQAISIEILNNFGEFFDYFKIAVIYRSGLDGALTAFENGVYPITQTNVTIFTELDKKPIDIADIFHRRTKYLRSRGLSEVNDYLFHYGLTPHTEWNLQPVVNLMGAFGRWVTVQANENIYQDGALISNFMGYMRDEVVPFGIVFYGDGGYESALHPFIPRPAFNFELDILGTPDFPEDTNTNSVLQNNPDCFSNLRDRRWQFENTATVFDDFCQVPATGGEDVIQEREVENTCYITDEDGELLAVDEIVESSIELDTGLDLVTYINTHLQEIIDSTGPNGADIRDILEDPEDYSEECVPDFGDNCSEEIELVSSEIFAISVETESTQIVNNDFEEYTRVTPPSLCSIYLVDDDGNPINDDLFVGNYMEASETVYKRSPSPTNTSCIAAAALSFLTNPQIQNTNYMMNLGEVGGGYSTLQTSLDASQNLMEFYLTLTGIAGTANINVNGTDYLATFNTDLTTTASDFVTTHAAAILLDTAVVVTANTGVLLFTAPFTGFPAITITNVTGDLDGTREQLMFTDKIHTNAIWFSGNFGGQQYTIVEASALLCSFPDDNSSQRMRISVFSSCAVTADLPTYSRIVEDVTAINDALKFIELNSADFGGTSANFYIVIDSPMRLRDISTPVTVATLTPPCGCFSIYQRGVESVTLINYTGLKFGKKQTYKSLCEFTVPVLNDCDPAPYQKGLFSYWESVEKYQCNSQLWNSSGLRIAPADIPLDIRTEFEGYYTAGTIGGFYVMNPDSNFMDKPIRHYKFPDSIVSPFMSYETPTFSQNPGAFNNSVIYPIGFYLSNTVINAFLDIAVTNGLISQEDRSKINRYEIFRGDRRVDKSVIAKGILFDTYKYTEDSDSVYYPNYPLNSLGTDAYNVVPHPYASLGNGVFSFHSPDTSFYKPTLTREMRVEGYQFGNSANYFDEVEGHSTYVLLGDRAYQVATGLGIAEASLELVLQIGDYLLAASGAGTIGGVAASGLIAALQIAAVTIGSAFKTGEYRLQWIETIRNLGKPTNFAYYQATVGHYNYFVPNFVTDSRLRGLTVNQYLNSGRWSVPDETTPGISLNVNNVDRESLVLLSTGDTSFNVTYPPQYVAYDNQTTSPATASRRGYDGTGRSGRLVGNAASPYASIKQYLPAQYGSIDSVNWLATGYCGNLDAILDCDPVFGGDTYISRFSLKRKLPFFTTDASDLPPLLAFKYSDYFNINPESGTAGRFFVDYLINEDADSYPAIFSFVFPSNRSRFNLDYSTDTGAFYMKTPSKFYLYSYGIPYFLVESEINCNFRYAKREPQEDFYPNVGDIIKWTQQKNVPISEPNAYFTNPVYSYGPSSYPWRMLPQNFERDTYDDLNDYSNSAIYSLQDTSKIGISDPWLVYRPLDFYSFPKKYGLLISLDKIESEQALARFTNGVSIFGAIDVLAERMTPDTKNVGQGGIFAGRALSFNETVLGYAGTQHTEKVSCEFGHFWLDAKRGKVFQLTPGGGSLNEVSRAEEINTGLEKWFKEHLPFRILKYAPDLTIKELDNAYKGIGITMGWDDRTKRVFITKKDYRPLDDVCYGNGIWYDVNTDNYQAQFDEYLLLGWVYAGIDECRFRFTRIVSGAQQEAFIDANEVVFGDPDYFEDCSFTVAYNPLLKIWVSYYSFKPNYYVSYNEYFQTGINFSMDDTEIGLWSHLPFQSSWQVFYGKRYPFTIEYPIVTKQTNSMLGYIEFWLDIRKYYDKYDYTDVYGVGFNKAVVYNNFQNTGQLILVHQRDNDLSQLTTYPIHGADTIQVLQTEINGRWTLNHLFNTIKNEKDGLPKWLNDCNQIDKQLNHKLLDYRKTILDYFRGDYAIVRLENDAESRYKYIFRFNMDERNFYEQ